MGAGNSKSPETGVPLNPRVYHADQLARKEGKQQIIDAPILVHLDQGTVRYRYSEEEQNGDSKNKNRRIEKPHEGHGIARKTGYFYHATLNDFSEEAAYSKEDEWKFLYVTQGPNSAKQKRLFYVYGKGMHNAPSQGLIKNPETRPQGQGYAWPAIFKQPGHLYFDVTFITQDREPESADDELDDMTNVEEEEAESHNMTLMMECKQRIQRLKKRLSMRLVKPVTHIHIYHNGKELHAGEVVGDLRSESDGTWKRFSVLLKPK